jgi:hypothetical protein
MKKRIQRKDAKMQRREGVCFSFTPGFSRAPDAGEIKKPFQRFSLTGGKLTRLKPGVNEISCAPLG